MPIRSKGNEYRGRRNKDLNEQSKGTSTRQAARRARQQFEEENPGLRDNRVAARKDFTSAIQEHGSGEPRSFSRATWELTKKIFRGGTPPDKRDNWSADDQMRIAVGESRAADDIRNAGPSGDEELIYEVRKSGGRSNGDMNDDGVRSWYNKIFRPETLEERLNREREEQLKESSTPTEYFARHDDDDDSEENPYASPSAKLLRETKSDNPYAAPGTQVLRDQGDDDEDPVWGFVKSFNLFG
jgi:hypothetical protein